VITVTVDTGGIDREAARAPARAPGRARAVEHTQVDARADYFEQVLRFLIMGNVRAGSSTRCASARSAVMQAQTIARLARKLGSTRRPRPAPRRATTRCASRWRCAPSPRILKVLAPVRDEAFKRQDELEYLQQRGLPLPPREPDTRSTAACGA